MLRRAPSRGKRMRGSRRQGPDPRRTRAPHPAPRRPDQPSREIMFRPDSPQAGAPTPSGSHARFAIDAVRFAWGAVRPPTGSVGAAGGLGRNMLDCDGDPAWPAPGAAGASLGPRLRKHPSPGRLELARSAIHSNRERIPGVGGASGMTCRTDSVGFAATELARQVPGNDQVPETADAHAASLAGCAEQSPGSRRACA